MKTLYIMRHGNAEEESSSNKDIDRRLTSYGIEEIKKTANKLIITKQIPSCIICSNALRAIDTANELVKALSADINIKSEPELYNAFPNEILKVIKENEQDSMMIIGHNFGISHIVTMLGDINNVFLDTAHCAIVHFKKEIDYNSGLLHQILHP